MPTDGLAADDWDGALIAGDFAGAAAFKAPAGLLMSSLPFWSMLGVAGICGLGAEGGCSARAAQEMNENAAASAARAVVFMREDSPEMHRHSTVKDIPTTMDAS